MIKNVQKDEALSLTESKPNLKKIMVGAGWDVADFDGSTPCDIDLSCFLLNPMGQTRHDDDFVFYNNLEAENGAVKHKGDNRTGAGEGDDEIIFLDLSKIDFEVSSIVFVASLYDGDKSGQSFTNVKNAFIRVYDEEKRDELLRFDLAEDFPDAQAVKIAVLERMGNEWIFKAIGEPAQNGLAEIAKTYGLLIANA